MKKLIPAVLFLLLCHPLTQAQKPHSAVVPQPQRPKVGLALSGGGAKGAAHIGVLKYMEEIGIPIDCIAGTSMGSIIGGLYALGYTPDEMADLISNINWSIYMSNNVDRYYQSSTIRAKKSTYLFSVPFGSSNFQEKSFNILSTLPSGVINGASLTNLFNRLSVGYNDSMDFSQLPIPFCCVATDILTGKPVILNHGNFAKAIRSSMAIPGVFSPVEWDGHLLADGGMVNNFPADLCLNMGADFIIGIELAEEMASDPKEMKSLPQQLSQYLSIAVNSKRSENRDLCDIYLHPDITGYNMLSFSSAAIDTLVRRGYECAQAHREELLLLKQRLEKYGPCSKTLQTPRVNIIASDDSILLTNVLYKGVLPIDAHWLIKRGGLESGKVTTMNAIERAIGIMMGTEAYSSITYNILPGDTIVTNGKPMKSYQLVIMLEPAEPHLLSIGFRYDSQEKSAILFHFGFNEQRLSGFKAGIDFNLNYNMRIATKLSWCNIGLGDINFAYRYHNSTLSIRSHDSTSLTSWRVNHHNFSLYLSEFHLRNFTFACGIDEDFYSNQNSFSLNDILYNGIFHFDQARGFFGAFLHGLYDNLDDAYFATKGLYAKAGVNWRVDNKNLFKKIDQSFFAFNFNAQTFISTSPKFTVIPQVFARILVGKNSAWYDNIIGGTIPGRYLDHQLPFIGLTNTVHVDNLAGIGRLDLRYRLLDKLYIYLMSNVLLSANWIYGDNNALRINYGAALRAAYDTPLGPISLDLNWNSFTKRPSLYLNIGHTF